VISVSESDDYFVVETDVSSTHRVFEFLLKSHLQFFIHI